MMFKRFAAATSILFIGLKEIFSRPKLFFLALIPFCIDILIFILGLSYGSSLLNSILTSALALIFPVPEGLWYQVAYYPLLVLFWLVFLISLSMIVYLVASVISSPFNALIAENILVDRGLIRPMKFTFFGFVRFSIKMILISLARAGILLSIAAVLFILSFFPGVNVLTSYLSAMIIGFDAADYTLELRDYSLKQRFGTFRQLFPEYAGMGLIMTLILMLPGFVILLMPVIVSGTTVIIGKALKETP